MGSNRIYLSPPHMSGRERELMLDAFDSNWIAPLGPHVDALETEFADICQVRQAVAVSSGTAALHLSLRLLDIQPGDEVWTSTLTFAATANAIRYVGAEPVFVDCDSATWNMDAGLLADALDKASQSGRLPKAVIVVDLYGQCADYDAICAACQRYDVPIIEDAAEALGASYKSRPAGGFGTLGCFSFNGNKIITASSGGMLVSDDEALCERARYLATQARDPAPHYQHSEVGYNYRLSNLLAAVARGQLSVLPQRVASRRQNYETYLATLSELPGIVFMPEPPSYFSTRWLTCVTIDPKRFGADADTVRLALDAENIESRPVWKPMHLQPVNAGCRSIGGSIAEKLFNTGLCLPSGSNLQADDLARVTNIIAAQSRQYRQAA